MNVDTLLHQYFPVADSVCIEMFDEKNIQQVYRRLVEVLIHHRTDPAEEFNELFLEDDPGLDKLW